MLTLRENMELVYRHEMPEYMPFITDFDIAMPKGKGFINERPNCPGVNDDWFGQSWTWEEKVGACNPTPGKPLLDDITQWEDKMVFPDVAKLEWEKYVGEETAGWDRKARMSRLAIGFGMWERMFSVMPFDEALVSLVEEPEACYDFFGAVADHKIRLHELAVRYYKPDVLIMHDDYGNHQNLFMQPDTWRKLLKPHLKRIVDHAHSLGVRYEHHNCGYWASIAQDMVELGVDATNTVDPCNDLSYIKNNFGDKMVMVGALDTRLYCTMNVTRKEITDNVEETYRIMAPGGNFIPSPQSARYGANYSFVEEEVRRIGQEYYGPRPENAD